MEDKTKVTDKIKQILGEMIGVEAGDVETDDSLREDFNMAATDISDFYEKLDNAGINVSKIDITDTDTLEEIFDQVGIEEF